jgi:hypothetical protein
MCTVIELNEALMHVQTPLMTEYLHIPLVLNLFCLLLQVVCIFSDRNER